MKQERESSPRGRIEARAAATGALDGHVVLSEGLHRCYSAAWAEIGYVDPEDRRRLMTTREAEAWLEAVLRARRDRRPASEDGSISDLRRDVAASIEVIVSRTLLEAGDEEPGLHLVETLLHAEVDDGLTTALVLCTLMRWLTAARESGVVDPTAVTEWLERSLSRLPAAVARSASGIIGHPRARAETMAEVHERLGPMFAPALLWLASGVAATAGGGDASWVRQFDRSGGSEA